MPLTLNASRYRRGFTLLLELMDRVFIIKIRFLPRRTYFCFLGFAISPLGEVGKPSQSSRIVTSAFLLHGIAGLVYAQTGS